MRAATPLAALTLMITCQAARGQTAETQRSEQADLTQVSIENLMNMQVTFVSKREQTLSRTAAAIFVITQEDIRQSGATNIPDVLRMVPGLDVAQINANTWAISARGFNGEFGDELLVLVDGRNVYVLTFAGVFWDVMDIPLENIARIEVIRGPGGAVLGANAVNGVITAAEADGERFGSDSVTLFRTVSLDSGKAGAIAIVSDLSALHAKLRQYTGISALVIALSVLATFLVLSRLLRLITEPILQLAGIARRSTNWFASADHSLDGARDEGRPGKGPGSRDGRLPYEADPTRNLIKFWKTI